MGCAGMVLHLELCRPCSVPALCGDYRICACARTGYASTGLNVTGCGSRRSAGHRDFAIYPLASTAHSRSATTAAGLAPARHSRTATGSPQPSSPATSATRPLNPAEMALRALMEAAARSRSRVVHSTHTQTLSSSPPWSAPESWFACRAAAQLHHP